MTVYLRAMLTGNALQACHEQVYVNYTDCWYTAERLAYFLNRSQCFGRYREACRNNRLRPRSHYLFFFSVCVQYNNWTSMQPYKVAIAFTAIRQCCIARKEGQKMTQVSFFLFFFSSRQRKNIWSFNVIALEASAGKKICRRSQNSPIGWREVTSVTTSPEVTTRDGSDA